MLIITKIPIIIVILGWKKSSKEIINITTNTLLFISINGCKACCVNLFISITKLLLIELNLLSSFKKLS